MKRAGHATCSLFLLFFNRVDRDLFAILAHSFELDATVNLSEECVIRTATYVVAGMDVCSSLLYKDVACKNKLTVCSLDAEAFAFGVTTVTG